MEREIPRRLTVIGVRLGAIESRLALFEGEIAANGVRLDRIERRVDLTEATHR